MNHNTLSANVSLKSVIVGIKLQKGLECIKISSVFSFPILKSYLKMENTYTISYMLMQTMMGDLVSGESIEQKNCLNSKFCSSKSCNKRWYPYTKTVIKIFINYSALKFLLTINQTATIRNKFTDTLNIATITAVALRDSINLITSIWP